MACNWQSLLAFMNAILSIFIYYKNLILNFNDKNLQKSSKHWVGQYKLDTCTRIIIIK